MSSVKKFLFLLAILAALLMLAHNIMTIPKPFSKAANLNFEVSSINLANGVNNDPGIKIVDREDIGNIMQFLNLYQYEREYHYPFKPSGGGGSLFKLGLNDRNGNQRILIHFNGKRITLKGQDYLANQDVSWTIAAYLMMENLDKKSNLSLIKTAHENINIISNRYGEQKPFIVQIKPGVTKQPLPRPMYTVHLQGNFKKSSLQAKNLYFSMQENYPIFWGITATDSNNKVVWEEKR